MLINLTKKLLYYTYYNYNKNIYQSIYANCYNKKCINVLNYDSSYIII